MQKRHWESGAMAAPVSDGENKRFYSSGSRRRIDVKLGSTGLKARVTFAFILKNG